MDQGTDQRMRIFGSPSRYIQGPGALAQLGGEVARLGRSAVLVADRRVGALVGGEAEASCRTADVALTRLEFGGEITYAEVARMEEACAETRPEVVVAAGGGKTIDASKLLGRALGARIVTVPTVASNDSPTSHIIVVYDEAHKLVGVERLPSNPDLVLVDTAVIVKAPAALLAAGIGDAVVKRFEVEQCVGAGGPNMFGGRSPVTALALARACYDEVRAHAAGAMAALRAGVPDEAFERVVEACVLMSGLAFESGGLSVCHGLTRGLSAVRGPAEALHGHQVAYGLLVQLTLEGRDRAFMDDMRGFFRQVGLPTSLRHIGFTEGSNEIALIADLSAQAAHMRNFARPLAADDFVRAIETVERDAA